MEALTIERNVNSVSSLKNDGYLMQLANDYVSDPNCWLHLWASEFQLTAVEFHVLSNMVDEKLNEYQMVMRIHGEVLPFNGFNEDLSIGTPIAVKHSSDQSVIAWGSYGNTGKNRLISIRNKKLGIV